MQNKTNLVLPLYQPGVPCCGLATHFRSHEDEHGAFVLLKRYGNTVHPGIAEVIQNKKILLWDAGQKTPDGRSWKEWHEQDGIVCVGVGGSPYDEHSLPKSLRGNECAATLVAQALGITPESHPETKLFLKLLLEHDRGGEKYQLSNSANIRRAHKCYSVHGEQYEREVIEYGMQALENLLLCQESFLGCEEEFSRNSRNRTIAYSGRRIRVTSIKTDNEDMSAYAKCRAHAHVVICQNRKGQVFIDTADTVAIDLTEVAKTIRMAEMDRRKRRYRYQDPALLEEGTYPGASEWHFQKENGKLMNGSLSAPNTPPTAIPFGALVRMVTNTLENISSVRNIQKKVA